MAGLAALAVLVFATGCKQQHGADVVASVNGHAISRTDLDRNFNDQQRGKQDQQPETEEQAKSDRLTILRTLIDGEIIEQRAAKMNLTATNEEVDAKLTEMKSRYTEEQFAEVLKESGRSLEEVRRDIRRQMTLEKLLNKEINSKINVTDAEVNAFFNAHKADFNLIEDKIHLAQIVVTGQPQQAGAANLQGSKATTDADARKKDRHAEGAARQRSRLRRGRRKLLGRPADRAQRRRHGLCLGVAAALRTRPSSRRSAS